jgi:glycosyltransferase involved in cell wall biosynthesis
MYKDKNQEKILLVGIWANRNWVLGNLLREVKDNLGDTADIWWVPSAFAGKSMIENFVFTPIPKYHTYYFSYLTVFEKYFMWNPERFKGNSIVLYTHNDEELGSLNHQVSVLEQAKQVHVMCSRDREMLIGKGLNPEKIKVVYFAIDSECIRDSSIARQEKTVILASRFSTRKGLHILPSLVDQFPDWKFIGLGRGWEKFIAGSSLSTSKNFSYAEFNKSNRNKFFSKASIFLSLSSIEGGPVPLIEAMSLGLHPVCTDTGFARDVITDNSNGILLPINPTLDQIGGGMSIAENLKSNPRDAVSHLTWRRMSDIILTCHLRKI